jgi:nucleoside-triphosphatase THEP1
MKLILTGQIGVGKTHVCASIIEQARKRKKICCGVLTWKIGDTLRVEDIFTGKRVTLAHKNGVKQNADDLLFCSYLFRNSAIEFAEKALDRLGELLIIDEFGPLELEGKGFRNAIPVFISNKNANSILVVRSAIKERTIELLNCDFRLFELTLENRETMPNLVFKELFG